VDVLNHLGQAAAIILLIELLVVLMIFLAVAGGLAFGLHWVRGKTDWAFGKINIYAGKGTGLIHKGTDYLALPFIKATGAAATARATLDAIERRVRQIQASRPVRPPVAARPVPPPVPVQDAEATTLIDTV
jgi:phage tail tape-measure protein